MNGVDDLFTEFCKEKNHINKLEYFCKTHNQLCCGLCIAKLNKRGEGQHKDCVICYIDEIKDEKKNKLKENIKILEDLENKFNESMESLKQTFQKMEKKKENLKLSYVGFIIIFNKLYKNNIRKKLIIKINRNSKNFYKNKEYSD